MRQERQLFIHRLAALASACEESLLVQLPINAVNALHNERARQLRCGICVQLFLALEDFVRSRVAEVVEHIDPNFLPFANLPTALQDAASEGALKGLAFQLQYFDPASRSAVLLREFSKLGTLGASAFSISKFAFVHSKVNVQAEELEHMLLAFNVEKPAETVFRTAQRINCPLSTSLKSDFEQLQHARHAAAHNSSFDIANNDLRNNVSSARSIGTALDIVMSCAVINMNLSRPVGEKKLAAMKAGDVLIFVVRSNRRGRFAVQKEGVKRTMFSGDSFDAVKGAVLRKLSGGVGVVVVTDPSGKPVEWYCRMQGD